MRFFKVLIVILILLIIQLQYRLWFGDGNIQQVKKYQQRLDDLRQASHLKKERNEKLYAEVVDLRKEEEAIEERARYDLGMIKEDETFLQIIE